MSALLAQLPPPPAGRTGWPWTEETPPAVYAGQTRWPRVSIVTPSYNQAAFIEETIRSILLQNYPDLQYVIIDGGSTDGSAEIIQKYAPWLTHRESERDRGQSHAINKGLSRCDGEWFNWINSDDCLLSGALNALARDVPPGVAIIVGAQTTGPSLSTAVPLGTTHIGASLEDTLVNHFICQQGLFLRTDLVKSLHGVREELHYVMDLDLFARALLVAGLESVRELPDHLAFFRRHDQAKTSLASAKFIHEERRLFHGLGAALGLDVALLRHIAAPADTLPATTPVTRLDRTRLSEVIALKYWWDGPVEAAWLACDFPTFKREVHAFRHAFPHLKNPRITRLSRLVRLPGLLLGLTSLARTRA